MQPFTVVHKFTLESNDNMISLKKHLAQSCLYKKSKTLFQPRGSQVIGLYYVRVRFRSFYSVENSIKDLLEMNSYSPLVNPLLTLFWVPFICSAELEQIIFIFIFPAPSGLNCKYTQKQEVYFEIYFKYITVYLWL